MYNKYIWEVQLKGFIVEDVRKREESKISSQFGFYKLVMGEVINEDGEDGRTRFGGGTNQEFCFGHG